ncbi:OmpA family protein [Reichenbachiella versicolor]|uniref:OmpA family protein n=1 Tax=Reichenbachiella versicolor TaxID=1821036 RepID=UPI000D6E50CC|nr:OmpA family protein [Reichenbachiella versicolor]
MRFFKVAFSIALILFNINVVKAQYTEYHSADKKALKYYNEARVFLKRAQFSEATPLLQKAISRDPMFIEVWLALGSMYSRVGNDSLTMQSFLKAVDIDPDYIKSRYAYYTIGELYFKYGDYVLSKNYLLHYLRTEHGDRVRKRAARDKIASCNFAIQAKNQPFDYQMTKLPDFANEFQMEYFAEFSVDMNKLYFTRRVGSNTLDDEDIFYSQKTEFGWSKPESISPSINTEENEGASSISADGRTIVFTSCNTRKGYGSCDLYISNKVGDEWSKPRNMGKEINSPAWDAQPALSADGRTIYFVSNRTGGLGNKDIWASIKDKNGYWTQAFNLGNRINTKRDEIAPFIHANGETIYFSSEGHETMGGLDFFTAELEKDSIWSFPRNLGYPLNDSNDQVSLTIASDGSTGIIAIEKEEDNKLHSSLYSIQLPETFRVKNRSNFLTGMVIDAETKLSIEASIKIYKLDDKRFYSELKSDKVSGEYTMVLTEGNKYGVYVTSPGYIFHDFKFELEDLNSFDNKILNIQLQPIREGAKAILGNIFFDHDSFEIKRESMSELREVYWFLRKNPEVIVEISGHTDASGNSAYNEKLSMNRAQTIFDFLVSKRIPPHQLAYKGYGSKQLLDEAPFSPKNRRIEFKVIEIVK